MKIIILSTLFLLFLLMTAAIYLCIFYEVIRLASSSYAAANNLKFGKYLRILSKVYIVVCLMFLVAVFLYHRRIITVLLGSVMGSFLFF